jgi:hypothetical protein
MWCWENYGFNLCANNVGSNVEFEKIFSKHEHIHLWLCNNFEAMSNIIVHHVCGC